LINFTFAIKIAAIWNDIPCQLAKENKNLSALWNIVVYYAYHAIASAKAGSEVFRVGLFNSPGVWKGLCGARKMAGFFCCARYRTYNNMLFMKNI